MDEVLADFIRVELDSKELTKDKNFAVKDGSIIVTLLHKFVCWKTYIWNCVIEWNGCG